MKQYQVNYSMRFIDGQFINQLRHTHKVFENWHDADNFKSLCESGNIFTRPDCNNDKYKTEDITLSAF